MTKTNIKWEGAPEEDQEGLNTAYATINKVAESIYVDFRKRGVSAEQAALILPRGVDIPVEM